MGTLYAVTLPFDNGEDVTLRALRVCREAALAVGEDPAAIRGFLNARGIVTPAAALPPVEDEAGCTRLLAALESGSVALIQSEWDLVPSPAAGALIRAALDRGVAVAPVPGPSGPLAALVTSGLPADTFLFLGPPGTASEPDATWAAQPHTLVAVETPDRLAAMLDAIGGAWAERPVALAGPFAAWPAPMWRGSAAQAREHLAAHPPNGRCVLIAAGMRGAPERWDEDRLAAEIRSRLAAGWSAAEIGRRLAAESGWPRRAIYRRAGELRG